MANARRAVACWNACDGVGTAELLTAGPRPVVGLLAAAMAAYRALEACAQMPDAPAGLSDVIANLYDAVQMIGQAPDTAALASAVAAVTASSGQNVDTPAADAFAVHVDELRASVSACGGMAAFLASHAGNAEPAPGTLPHHMTDDELLGELARAYAAEEAGLPVYTMDDQPVTCPTCGRRPAFAVLPGGATAHACVCGARFIAEPDTDDDSEEDDASPRGLTLDLTDAFWTAAGPDERGAKILRFAHVVEPLAVCDALEIAACAEDDGEVSRVEPDEWRDLQAGGARVLFSVYWHIDGQGVDCFADLPTLAEAEQLAELLAARFNLPVHNFAADDTVQS